MSMLDLSHVAGLRLADPPGPPTAMPAPGARPLPPRAPEAAAALAPPAEMAPPVAAAPGAWRAAPAAPAGVAPPVAGAPEAWRVSSSPSPKVAPPVAPALSAEVAPDVEAAPEARRIAPAVLIVDDNVRLAQTVATYMEMQGFRAHAAHSAEEALLATQRLCFDLVLLDINMPGMDGLEVCRRLLAAAPGMRVLMVTGRDSQEDPLRAAAAGARTLLTKPISLAALRDEMVRALAEPG